jgi:cell wall-associated NlpC family hydrolase
LLGVLLSFAVIGSAVLTVPSALAAPTPTLKEVEQKVSLLQTQAEQANEEYDQTRVRLKSINVRLAAAQAQMVRQRTEVRLARVQVGRLASETYRRGQLSTLDLVLGDDPESALAQAGYLPSLGDRQVGAMDRLSLGEQRLAQTQTQITSQQHNATLAEARLKQSRDTANQKLAEATAVVSRLKASERTALTKAQTQFNNVGLPSGAGTVAYCKGKAAAAPSSAARTALDFACSHLGDAYVWGGSGPTTWDCSGLTMGAYGAAGISLPHSSALQAGYGTRVSVSSLEPGDLIFFYSPISHVAIYLGGGLMVHAPHSGDVVRVASVYQTPVAAVRF